jgi:hypothetical protein
MSDPDGDNIWEATISLPAGPIEFKYSHDAWTGQESLIQGTPCTVTIDNFTNRFLEITGDTVLPVVCWGSCVDCAAITTSMVTFKVDMSEFGGNFTTPEVNGTFNGWCGGCNPLSDDDGDGIWEVTLELQDVPVEYKFAYDSWAGQESLTQGTPCTVTNGGFTNRFLDISADTILDPVCWNSCDACAGITLDQIDLPIDWEGETTDYTVTDFGGNASAVVVDPTDASNTVLQSTKTGAAELWAGTTLSTPDGLASPIPFEAGKTKMMVDVWSPDAGIPVRLKVEDHTNAGISVETEVLTTVAMSWETLTFDFSNEASGTAPINLSNTYDMVSIFYNFGTDGATAGEKTYYCDNVMFDTTGTVVDGPVYCNTEVTHLGIPAETASAIFLTVANTGTNSMKVEIESADADPVDLLLVTGGSGAVISDEDTSIPGKISRSLTWDTPPENVSLNVLWSKVSFGGNWQLSPEEVEVPFTDTCGTGGSTTSMVTFKVDMNEYTGTYTSVELNGTFNGWCGNCNPMLDEDGDGVWEVTLELDNGSIEYKFTHDSWAGQEEFDGGEPCTVTNGDGFTNRFLAITGDVELPVVCWASCNACGALSQIDLPIDWEGETTDYTVTDFGGNASAVVVDPTDASNTVLRSVKSDAAELWAGTTLSTPDGLASPIPFEAGKTKMMVDVWSPDAGIPVRVKVEDHTNAGISVETEATTTTAGAWETLTFDFSNEASGTAPINLSNTYDMVSIFYNFGTDGATAGEKTYYCDNVMFDTTGTVVDGPVYCNTEVTHLGIPAETASAIFLTVANTGTNSMKVEIESADADPVDLLLVTGGSGAVISDEDTSIPGKISRSLTWDTPPENVSLNVLWSKVSFGGNWQLSPEEVEVPFTDTCGTGGSTTSMVTFKVDMNEYTGTFTSIELNGTFNGWCGNCNPMSDEDGDGVWEVTLELDNGSIEYKFTHDNWAGQEEFLGGEPCTVTNDGFTNRFLEIAGDVSLNVVCWASCEPCGGALDQIDLPIDWEGDTTNYTVTDFGGNISMLTADPTDASNTVLESVKPEGAELWAGTTLSTPSGLASPIAFDNENTIIQVRVYAPLAGMPVRLKAEDHTDPTKSVETEAVTTVAEAWETLSFDFANEAEGTAPLNFGYTYDMLSIFYNFGTDGNTAGSLTSYCDDIVFGGGGFNQSQITFKVDMSEHEGGFNIVELNGTFNGWCGNCTPMSDDDGDDIWEVTVTLDNGPIEYKFSFDNWNGQEDLTPGDPCTVTIDGFTNRFLEITGDTTLAAVCWDHCVECDAIGIQEPQWVQNLAIYPNPTEGLFMIQTSFEEFTNYEIFVMDISGRMIERLQGGAKELTQEMSLESFENGVYLVKLRTENAEITSKLFLLE